MKNDKEKFKNINKFIFLNLVPRSLCLQKPPRRPWNGKLVNYMNEKSQKILESLKNKKVGVFIDDANLFYAKKKVGWQIDFKKLRILLEQTMQVEYFGYYIVMPANWDSSYKKSDAYLKKIKETAKVTVKIKPLKYIKAGSALIKKGDVDLEIAVDVMRNLEKVDAIIIVSGDSDYIELRDFLLEQSKQIIFFAFRENIAWEIRKKKFVFLNDLKNDIKLE